MRGQYAYLQKHALAMLTLAIYHGDLVPSETCEKCGTAANGKALDGHHEDYSKPLDVVWLCRDCHKKEHKRDGLYFFSRNHKPSPRLEKALNWLKDHREHWYTAPRELEAHIEGVSYGTIFKAQQLLRNNDEGEWFNLSTDDLAAIRSISQ